VRDKLIFIESNTSGTGRLFVSTARRLGIEPVMLTEDPLRYPYLEQDEVEVVRQSCLDLTSLDRCLDDLARACCVAGIYSSSEYFIETAAELALRRRLPGPDPQAVRDCRDKWSQYQRLQAARVAVPRTMLARSSQEASDAAQNIGMPVVLKPSRGTGSVGVRLCSNSSEVQLHAAQLLAVRENERGIPVPQEVLVQEYIQWPEYSAEVFGGRLLGITRKHVSEEPYFVETGHDFPFVFLESEGGAVTRAILRALEAVGMLWGPVHIEFRFHGGRFTVMEINPRLAGGFIPELVRLATGIDLVQATILLTTGKEPELTPAWQKHASIRFLRAPAAGTLEELAQLGNVVVLPEVADVQIYKKPGDRLTIWHDFRDRIGHVICVGDDGPSAALAAERARENIKIRVTTEASEIPSGANARCGAPGAALESSKSA
jgi:biotin carboxylase